MCSVRKEHGKVVRRCKKEEDFKFQFVVTSTQNTTGRGRMSCQSSLRRFVSGLMSAFVFPSVFNDVTHGRQVYNKDVLNIEACILQDRLFLLKLSVPIKCLSFQPSDACSGLNLTIILTTTFQIQNIQICIQTALCTGLFLYISIYTLE